MRLIIAGGRNIVPTIEELNSLITMIYGKDVVTEVVCGGCKGVDTAGKAWANSQGIPLANFTADWALEGKKAGPKRNEQMAEYAEALLLIWNGKSHGSLSMLDFAQIYGLDIKQVIL